MTAPPYQRIAEEIRVRISTGELRPGDRVPSARQLTRDWGVAIATATKALAALRQEGLTEARTGVGTVVAKSAPGARNRLTTPLDRARIVRAAVAAADANGLTEVSLRRIATELGVTTAALQRHVPDKDALVLAMIDAAFAEEPLPAVPPYGWRARLELSAGVQWRLFRRHPWLAPAMSLTRPQMAPHAMLHTEWALSAFEGTGLPMRDRLYLYLTLFTFGRGLATAFEEDAAALQDSGMSVDEWMQTQQDALDSVTVAQPMPAFQRIIEHDDLGFDLDQLFTYGLHRLLDSAALLIHRRRHPVP